MVMEKPTRQFPGNTEAFFEDLQTPERQRSGVAHCMLWQRSYPAHGFAQAGSIRMVLRYLTGLFRSVGWSKRIACSGASCGFLEILHKNYFRAKNDW